MPRMMSFTQITNHPQNPRSQIWINLDMVSAVRPADNPGVAIIIMTGDPEGYTVEGSAKDIVNEIDPDDAPPPGTYAR